MQVELHSEILSLINLNWYRIEVIRNQKTKTKLGYIEYCTDLGQDVGNEIINPIEPSLSCQNCRARLWWELVDGEFL